MIASPLQSSGLKETKPRVKILQLMQQTTDHLTAEEIYQRLKANGEDIVLATVYRVLKHFEEAALVKKHHFISGVAVYEMDSGEHHDHLVCVNCAAVVEFVDETIEQHQAAIARDKGFTITDHCLTIYGLCSDCR